MDPKGNLKKGNPMDLSMFILQVCLFVYYPHNFRYFSYTKQKFFNLKSAFQLEVSTLG